MASNGCRVTKFSAGDWVAIGPQIPCNECFYSKRGTTILCDNVKFMASKGYVLLLN